MKHKTYHWAFIPEADPEIVQHLQEVLGIDAEIAHLLAQKDIKTFDQAKQFFRPKLEDLHNPFLMKNMDTATQRILQAINNQEFILIYGDYDVDGTTAVTMMYHFLSTLGAKVQYYIPDRYNEGYGISDRGIDFAIAHAIQLIISLDCGIKANEKIQLAKKNAIDFIVCDHHLPDEILPSAVAILNPKQKDCNYPYTELSGCGVGFKLIQALLISLHNPISLSYNYLDLVAISISADIVPITGENRTLTYYGLKKLNQNPFGGLKQLLNSRQEKNNPYSVNDVVFKIAPLINAAGRIAQASLVVDLMLAQDVEMQQQYFTKLHSLNQLRKNLDAQVTQEALAQIETKNEINANATVVYQENWHKGVLGIVASRLIDTYYRPTLVFCKSKGKLVASARSIRGYDIYEALTQCHAYLEQFGGHKYAAGLTISPENYKSFKEKFESVVQQTLDESIKKPTIFINIKLSLTTFTTKFYNIIKQFQPFGPKNMKPVFHITIPATTQLTAKAIGKDNKHLKMNIYHEINKQYLEAIGFNLGHLATEVPNRWLEIIATLEENYFNGITSMQLNIKDLKIN